MIYRIGTNPEEIMTEQRMAIELIRTLRQAGHQAVFAGGSVRDMLLGHEAHDIDIATSATPDQVEALFEHTIPVGKAFGVVIVRPGEGHQFEVATFRTDGEYTDGRRPDSVTFATMREDALRRDLTINGMFFDPINHHVFDFVGGELDLRNGVIRLIGDPQVRIDEDKLRILRVARFAARFGFSIDPATRAAVVRNASRISEVSPERVFEELLKILRLRVPRKALDLLFELDLIGSILPEVKALKGLEQPPEYHPEGDVLEHTTIALEKLPEDASDALLVGTLLHDIGKGRTQTFEDRIRFSGHDKVGADMARKIMARFHRSNAFADHVVALVANHMRWMFVEQMRLAKLKRFMGMEFFEDHMELHRADCLSSHEDLRHLEFVKERLESFTPEEIRPPRLVTGHDLIEMGLRPGPRFKELLAEVEVGQLEGMIHSREEALEHVKSLVV